MKYYKIWSILNVLLLVLCIIIINTILLLLLKSSFFHWIISYYHWLSIYIFYHVTLEYDFWYSDCFLSFLFVNICFPSQKSLPKLPNKVNIIKTFQVKTFLKMCWKKSILGLDSNAAFAAKKWKMCVISQLLQLFFQN